MGIFKRSKKIEEADAPKTHADDSTTAVPSAAAIKAGSVASSVILSPLVTEKTAQLASQSQYVFRVDTRANKIQIGDAIRSMYGVTPVSINIQNQEGKRVRFGRTRGVRARWKKAIVTLPKGKTIEVYEGV